MSNTHKSGRFKKHLSTGLTVSGLVLLFASSQQELYAQGVSSTGIGSSLGSTGVVSEMKLQAAPLLVPLMQVSPYGNALLIAFGMILVLLGFGLHALLILHGERPRSVPVRAVAARKNESTTVVKKASTSAKVTADKQSALKKKSNKKPAPHEIIWIERTFRI